MSSRSLFGSLFIDMKAPALLFAVVSLWATLAQAEVSSDPSDLWYRAFLKLQTAEDPANQDQTLERVSALNEAFEILKRIALEHPEFQPDLVRFRLQKTAEEKFSLIRLNSLSRSKGAEIEPLEKEIQLLEERIRQLRMRIRALNQNSREMEKEAEDSYPRVELPKLPGEESFLDDEVWTPFPDPELAPTPDADLFPGEIELGVEPKSPSGIPKNWIPKHYDGQLYFIVPLIETPETSPFSKISPAFRTMTK